MAEEFEAEEETACRENEPERGPESHHDVLPEGRQTAEEKKTTEEGNQGISQFEDLSLNGDLMLHHEFNSSPPPPSSVAYAASVAVREPTTISQSKPLPVPAARL